jgi:regulator of cell morphogenesis and NO signaling
MNHAATLDHPTTDRAQQAIGQIAVNLPGSTAVFSRLKRAFCCGGQVALQTACEAKGLALQAVLDELAQLDRPATQAAPQAPAAMIDHILERYHAVHREQLPELIRMARRVEAVHRDSPDVPVGLAAHLEAMEAELLEHMEKEETVLFPMLKAGGTSMVRQRAPVAITRVLLRSTAPLASCTSCSSLPGISAVARCRLMMSTS